MGWWFGRKAAPADARPFVPAWLNTDSQEEGFARSIEGLTAFVKDVGVFATYVAGDWEIGVLRGSSVQIAGTQVIATRAAAIADPTGGSVIDAQARGALGQVLAALRHHGLIDA